MLEAVTFIGKNLGVDEEMLSYLIEDLSSPKQEEEQYLVKLKFFEEGEELKFNFDLEEIPEEYKSRKDFLFRWRFVGNASGNIPQIFLTVSNLNYLMGSTLSNLYQTLLRRSRQHSELALSIDKILKGYFVVLPNGESLFDIRKIGFPLKDDKLKENLNELDNFLQQLNQYQKEQTDKKAQKEIKDIIKKAKELIKKKDLAKLVAQELSEEIAKKIGVKKRQIALWTIVLNNKPLIDLSPYDDVIIEYRTEGFEKEVIEGYCSICGEKKDRVSPTAFKRLEFFKPYITDKIGFASELNEKGFSRNFLICEECFNSLLVAERYMLSNLGFRIGNLSFLLLPSLLLTHDLEGWKMDFSNIVGKLRKKTQNIVDFTGQVRSIADEKEFEKELRRVLYEMEEEGIENQALLTFLFYQKTQSEFRVLSLIEDVAPSWLFGLFKKSNQLSHLAAKLLGGDCRDWWLDLTRLYYLLPLREGDKTEHKKLLYLYHGLLKREPIDYDFLVTQFVTLARLYLTDSLAGTNQERRRIAQENRDWILSQEILRAGFLIKLLQEEKLLKGVKNLTEVSEMLEVKPEIKNYLLEMKYSEPQAALFLMGYLISEVGKGQYSSGHKSKPILDKINYQGMSFKKVQQLSNLIFEKLRQYDKLRFNEQVYSEMKKLMDKYRGEKDWPLTSEENVFYILSGYAFGSRMSGKKENLEEKEEEE
ncbi:CRISPR-associated protein Cas8b/Csh1 [Thermoanaerobacter kivui]|uniref:CRISPR-associated protein Cas8b/Csh1 n=1 Tax=Thermoanaerobacter kivui TaxID=2325 RepID=A0A097AUI3_THEKI|nr:TIGR02556 family CRISPR-associated protein [Thermoanaerobacter kivui]AIS53489.1 CRISPR-associated protein Cas8b/Csh1 [Thermoanaerobacter kivui]